MVDIGVQEELLRHLLKSQLVSQKELFANERPESFRLGALCDDD